MSDDPFLKCPCLHCGGSIEFPAQGVGLTIECPHCGQRTTLTGPPARETATPSAALEAKPLPLPAPQPVLTPEPTTSKPLVWVVTLLLLAVLAAGAFWYFTAGPGSRRKETVPAEKPAKKPAKPAPPVATNNATSNDTPAAISPPNKEKSIDDLKPGAVTLEKAKSGSLVYGVGTVKNDSLHQRFGVKVEIEFTDAKGRPAGKATDYTQLIEPRQEWRFRALVLDSKAASGKVVGIKEDN